MRRYPLFFLRWKAHARSRAHRGSLQVVPGGAGERNLLVYTPASYGRAGRAGRADARYPVIYMQDGQNLFDPRTSFAGDWGLKGGLAWASRRGADAIVVGIPHSGTARIDDYTPFVDPKVGGGQGERYLDYLINRIK
ncbi:MAG TPA: alpha/beta hydrolase-fold protein, partial [Gemmatimonadales bacterium]|nr:alpha/beta hydrolase-fold protein [Gemmatimonadales bacterium]